MNTNEVWAWNVNESIAMSKKRHWRCVATKRRQWKLNANEHYKKHYCNETKMKTQLQSLREGGQWSKTHMLN
jgi:hypothetical protein